MLKLAPLPIFVYHRMTSQSWMKRKNMLQENSGETFHSSLACCHWKLLLQLWKVSIEWVSWVRASVCACVRACVYACVPASVRAWARKWVSLVCAYVREQASKLRACVHEFSRNYLECVRTCTRWVSCVRACAHQKESESEWAFKISLILASLKFCDTKWLGWSIFSWNTFYHHIIYQNAWGKVLGTVSLHHHRNIIYLWKQHPGMILAYKVIE